MDSPPSLEDFSTARCAWGRSFAAMRVQRQLAPCIGRADVVHVHSNGLLAEMAVLLARRAGKPAVLTLYGTEIWHYEPRRLRPDLFTRAYHAASNVTFYSDRLMSRAHELGLGRRNARVVYPPVGAGFVWHENRRKQPSARRSASRTGTCCSTSSGCIRWPASACCSRR